MPVLSAIPSPARTAPRYCPQRPFPAYRFVPGLQPHPTRDPDGHSYGAASAPNGSWDPAAWRRLTDWLAGVDLFNAFYFWEAHEAWEGLWGAAPRTSAPARMLQGLIQVSAALLKIHLGSLAAALALSRRGIAKVAATAAAAPTLLGLDVRETAANFHNYFCPLEQRTLPPLDASVPLLRLVGLSDA